MTFIFSEFFCKALNTSIKKLSLKVLNPFTGETLPVFVYNPTEALHDLYPFGCNSSLMLQDQSEINLNILTELGLKNVNVISRFVKKCFRLDQRIFFFDIISFIFNAQDI